MLLATIIALSLSGPALQENSPAETPEVAAQPATMRVPASTSPVRSITTQAPVTGPTRTVCGWEAATGSTMRRRVCREVAANGDAATDAAREMLRQMQGSRYGDLPIARQSGGRPVF